MDEHNYITVFRWLEECVSNVVEREINFLTFRRVESKSIAVALELAYCLFSSDRWPDDDIP